MSYIMAIQQFKENVDLTDRVNDPRMWNLNAGLVNLTEALREDLAEIKSELEDIERELQSK